MSKLLVIVAVEVAAVVLIAVVVDGGEVAVVVVCRVCYNVCCTVIKSDMVIEIIHNKGCFSLPMGEVSYHILYILSDLVSPIFMLIKGYKDLLIAFLFI